MSIKDQIKFESTDWFKGSLGKGKYTDPNEDFDVFYRIVNTSKIKLNTDNILKDLGTISNSTPTPNSPNAHKYGIFDRGSSGYYDTKDLTQTPSCIKSKSEFLGNVENDGHNDLGDDINSIELGNNNISEPLGDNNISEQDDNNNPMQKCLSSVLSDEIRLTIGYDTEFYYDSKHPKVKNVLSWQFAFYLTDKKRIGVVVIVAKPKYKNRHFIYKRITINQALGCILDLCTFVQDKKVAYADIRVPAGDWMVTSPTDVIKDKEGNATVTLNAYSVVKDAADGDITMLDVKHGDGLKSYHNKYGNYTGKNAIKITILCHAGKADLPSFARNDKYTKGWLEKLSEVQGGLVSMNPVFFHPSSKEYWKFYPCSVMFRDTMCLAPAGHKKLEDLGEVIGVPKLKLPDGVIEHMDVYYRDHWEDYMEYASYDSIVTVMYASSIFGINKALPVTTSSASASIAKGCIMDYYGVNSVKDFNAVYRGLISVKKGIEETSYGYSNLSNLEPYNVSVKTIRDFATESYAGGINGCIRTGWLHNGKYYDIDMRNAYLTAMACVPDVDFLAEGGCIINRITNRYLCLQDFHSPFDPIFCYVTFEFPEDCKFTCIPVRHGSSLIFPRTSEGLQGVYACGPDLYLALQLGAKIYVIDGVVGKIRLNANGTVSHSLAPAVKQMVDARNQAAEIYSKALGRKSVQECFFKESGAAMYGKVAQDVIEKHRWSGHGEEYVDIGPSAITDPVRAALITAGVRCVLIAAMNQLHLLDYYTDSVTTDGFITDAMIGVLESLDLYGFQRFFAQARLYLTDGKDPSIWTVKHEMSQYYNLSTRANISPEMGGVCAHGGISTGYTSDSQEDRNAYLRKVITREGKVETIDKKWTSWKEVSQQGVDCYVYDKPRYVSFAFDMKRKPIEESITAVKVNPDTFTISEDGYEIATVDTMPFDSIEEYEKYRKAVPKNCRLRTVNDWKIFFSVIHGDADVQSLAEKDTSRDNVISIPDLHIAADSNKHIIKDFEWTKLMSVVIGYRQGLWDIPALNDLSSADKIKWFNDHSHCDKELNENSWKNARRPERMKQMLPKVDIMGLLSEMGAVEIK